MMRVLGMAFLLMAGPPPAAGKWEGPWIASPGGGTLKTTIFYGPWQCRRSWFDDCNTRCAADGHRLMGCIWLADIKLEWRGTVLLALPAAGGGRQAITHCCCDYPIAPDRKDRRKLWNQGRETFRNDWSKEFGSWPKDASSTFWPGHHIHDLMHGGAPLAKGNVLPVPPAIHDVINNGYPACYGGQPPWNTPGPEYPYAG